MLGSTPSRRPSVLWPEVAGAWLTYRMAPDSESRCSPSTIPRSERARPVPRRLNAFLSQGAAYDLPGFPVVPMHRAAPGDALAAMDRGLAVQVVDHQEAVAVLEYQDLLTAATGALQVVGGWCSSGPSSS